MHVRELWYEESRRREVGDAQLRAAVERRCGTAQVRRREMAFELPAAGERRLDRALCAVAVELRGQLEVLVRKQRICRIFLRRLLGVGDAAGRGSELPF